VEAGDLSLMLRKSVEARDWLATVEPRSVRAVMKRIVEDVTIIGTIINNKFKGIVSRKFDTFLVSFEPLNIL
jgi:hypothetical protein